MIRLLALVPLAFLAACSPYVYDGEIGKFSAGVDLVTDAYKGGVDDIRATRTALRTNDQVQNKARLGLSPSCRAIEEKNECQILDLRPDKPKEQDDAEHALNKAEPVFAALHRYAEALAAITKADDDKALTQAGQELADSVSGLAGAAGGGDAAAAAIAADTGLLANLTEIYLDSRRLATLKKTVLATDPKIETLSKIVGITLRTIQSERLRQLDIQLSAAITPLRDEKKLASLSPDDYRADLTATQALVDEVNRIKASDPIATGNALAASHHALAEALSAEKGQSMAVFQATTGFLQAAGKVKAAIHPDAANGQKGSS